MYEKLKADVEFLNKNYELAAEMYLEGALDGDAVASFNYGYCLRHGYGVKKDPLEAKSFFAFARDMEGGEASYNIAMLYLHGEGVPKDYKKAYEHLRISADKGCVEALLYLGMAYTSGYMMSPDIIGISMIPTHKPEYRDYSLLLDGFVDDFELDEEMRATAVKMDARRAFECFQAAARHDPTYVEDLVAKGKFLYARCYVDGLGVDFDREKSIRLMLLAGKSGSKEAISYIAENGLTPEMLEKPNRGRLKGR